MSQYSQEAQYSFKIFKKNTLRQLKKFRKWFFQAGVIKRVLLIAVIVLLVGAGIFALWVATLKIPDLQSFQNKALAESTKIYDRTGTVLLYDLNQDVKRQVVPFDQISPYIKQATVSIEDDKFYSHNGIEISSIVRAFLADLTSLKFKQGGSTITQQVIKNSLLTTDKSISRKIKEWVLALKLERVMNKDGILNLYLNGTSYGGSFYGVEEAAENFFGTSANNVDLAEAAYIAAIPQAPTYFSPYGNHLDDLNARKNLVLEKMKEGGYITDAQYQAAVAEKVTFKPQDNHSIKAPHFVMYIKDYLTQKYGEDMVDNGDLKVITTLDYDMQQKGEAIVKQYALANVAKFNATNAALVAIDPTTGQILTMVGSRDYFDTQIDGNFNVALAHRQPGSAFKPFAYVTAFEKGYTPDTVVFDVPTQFSTSCDAEGNPLSPGAVCYMPQNYDDQFRGPMSLRNAISQSINIPSIKVLYLAGISDTLQTAKDMGITSLGDANQYGLTLVLGGGEVSPLEMTSAYGVFANNGVRNPETGILKVTDKDGNILEQFTPHPSQVLPLQPTLEMNDVLHDNNARLPLNGPNSATDFPDREVALKTGTTNDSRDAWIVGYTPQIVVGAWAGNNDNSPMVKKTSGLIVAPLWRAFMDQVLSNLPPVSFERPDPIDPNLKPILRGIWQGTTYDPVTGAPTGIPNVHSILYWVDRTDPTGPPPTDPNNDPQFKLWEPGVEAWAAAHPSEIAAAPAASTPTTLGTTSPVITIITPVQNSQFVPTDKVLVSITHQGQFPLARVEFYVNDSLIGTATAEPFSFSFSPTDIQNLQSTNTLKVVGYDEFQNRGETSTTFYVNNLSNVSQ